MRCPLCKENVFCVNPCWLENKIIEACRSCRLRLNLRGINIAMDKERVPHWKAHIPAILK